MADDRPSREELIEARARLRKQLGILRNPIGARDRNRALTEKLQALIDEINDCLAETFDSDCRRIAQLGTSVQTDG